MALYDDWKQYVHHKTARKLADQKLKPEDVKTASIEELVKKHGFSEEGAKEIQEKLKSGGSEEPAAEPAKPKEIAAKEVKADSAEKPEKKGKRADKESKDSWVDPRSLPMKERLKLAQKICKDSGLMVNIASEMKELDYGRMSTGLTALDALLDGGWPVGKFSLIAGKWQSCKSLLALLTIAKNQKEDPNALWVWADAENAFDKEWAIKQGVDLERLIIVQPMIADDMFTEIERLIREVGPTGVIVDSIGSLLSWQEVMKDRDDKDYTKGIDKDTMALTARFLNKFYRRFTPLVAKHTTTFILITHLYSTMDQYKPEAPKGGSGMLYQSHIMVWTDRRKGDQDKKQKIRMPDGRVVDLFTAYEMVATVHKTRQSATEGHKVAIPFVYGKGLSETDSVIEMALGMGVVQADGHYYTHPAIQAVLQGKNNGWVHGRDATISFIRDHEEIFTEILKGVGEKMAAEDTVPEDEESSDGEPASE